MFFQYFLSNLLTWILSHKDVESFGRVSSVTYDPEVSVARRVCSDYECIYINTICFLFPTTEEHFSSIFYLWMFLVCSTKLSRNILNHTLKFRIIFWRSLRSHWCQNKNKILSHAKRSSQEKESKKWTKVPREVRPCSPPTFCLPVLAPWTQALAK